MLERVHHAVEMGSWTDYYPGTLIDEICGKQIDVVAERATGAKSIIRSVASLKMKTETPSFCAAQDGHLVATSEMLSTHWPTHPYRGKRRINFSAPNHKLGRTTPVVVLALAATVVIILLLQPWRDKVFRRQAAHQTVDVAVDKDAVDKDAVDKDAVDKDGKEVRPRVRVRVEPRHNFTLPLNNPQYVAGSQANFMKPTDYVVGVIQRGVKRAYPWVALANHHIVHDTIGGAGVFIAHCEVCSGAAAFSSTISVGGRQTGLSFSMAGIRRGTWIARDSMTNSLWAPFTGRATAGSLAGKSLTRLRSYTTTWGEWLSSHPDTQVAYLSEEMRRRPHGMGHLPGDRSVYPTWHQQQFRRKLEESDKLRWRDPSELVFGLFDDNAQVAVAYPLAEMDATGPDRMRRVTLADRNVILVIAKDAQGLMVAAYHSNVNGHELEFSLVESEPLQLRDGQANLWNFWGECVSGVNKGSQLQAADGYLTKWFEWLEGFPNTELVGNKLNLSVAEALRLARTKPASEAYVPWKD